MQGESEKGPWQSQELVLEENVEMPYPNRYLVRFNGDTAAKAASMQVGMLVEAAWTANVREYTRQDGTNGYQQELRGWKIQQAAIGII